LRAGRSHPRYPGALRSSSDIFLRRGIYGHFGKDRFKKTTGIAVCVTNWSLINTPTAPFRLN
jgi:hypothetical protein